MFDKLKAYIEKRELAQYVVGATIGTVLGIAVLKIWESGYTTGFAAGIDFSDKEVNGLLLGGKLLWSDGHPVIDTCGVQISGKTDWVPSMADPTISNRTSV